MIEALLRRLGSGLSADRVARTPTYDRILREIEEVEDSDRTAVFLKHQQLSREQDERIAAAEARLNRARGEEVRAQQALEERRSKRLDAERDHWGLSTSYYQQVSELERRLRDSADPRISAAQEALAVEAERLMRSGSIERIEYGPADVYGRQKAVNNRESVLARLAALRAAVREMEALKLQPLTSERVAGELEQLAQGIPEVQPAEAFLPMGSLR